jgi:hypothetical protein
MHASAITAAWQRHASGHRRPRGGTLTTGKGDSSNAGPIARHEGIALISLARLDAESPHVKKPQKSGGLAEERKRLLALISPSLRDRYAAAVTSGQRPAVCTIEGAQCSGCGQRLSEGSRRLLTDGFRVVPCSGCLRLLYDCAWVERDFMPLTLRPHRNARQ